MKNLFLLLFSFIVKREVKEAKSFAELCVVATKLCHYGKNGFRLRKKYGEYLVRQAMALTICAEEVKELSKILEKLYSESVADLIKSFIKKRTIYAEDLPFLLKFSSIRYSKETLAKLIVIIKDLTDRVGHGELLIIASIFRNDSYSGNGKISIYPFDDSFIDKLTDKLVASVEFMDTSEVAKCKEIVRWDYLPKTNIMRLTTALAENKKISSFYEAIDITRQLIRKLHESHFTALVDETIVLAEREIRSPQHVDEMLKYLDKNASCMGIKNSIIAKAISLVPSSGCLSFDDLAFLISHVEWPDDILLKNILGAILKTARLQKMTANDAVIMASEFSTEDTRYVFLRLYVEEIWEPNFNEALILWGSYKNEGGFPKDDMVSIIFSALRKNEVELGAEELLRTQVWGAGRGDSKRMPQVMLDKVEAFIKEVIEDSKALSA